MVAGSSTVVDMGELDFDTVRRRPGETIFEVEAVHVAQADHALGARLPFRRASEHQFAGTGFKSEMVFNLYLSAVACVTATTSLSSAGEGVSMAVPDGSFVESSPVTA